MIIKTKHVAEKKVLEENVWMKLKGDLYFDQSTRLPLSCPSRLRQCGSEFIFVSLTCSKEIFFLQFIFAIFFPLRDKLFSIPVRLLIWQTYNR